MDLALSEGQVLRWYGVSLDSLFPPGGKTAGISLREVYLPGVYAPVRQRFLILPRLAKARWFTLRHLAGLAALRREVGALKGWQVEVQAARDHPDALWQGRAVEYDAGAYSIPTLRLKLGTYERYPEQLWGTVSPERRALLLRLAEEMQLQNLADVLVAPWD